MKLIIDRFEGNYAVVETENKKMFNLPKEILPSDAKEGDVISIIIDHTTTKERKEKISRLMDDLWN